MTADRRAEMTMPKALQKVILLGMLSGCAAPPIFPPDVLGDVDHTLTFATLTRNPNTYGGSKIELGGQIVGSSADQEEVRILVRELSIRTHPVYGPLDTGGFRGMFVVVYPGKLTAQDLQHGNMVVVVATVMGAVWDTMTGAPVRRPTMQAECLHIWRTAGHAIEDFPWLPTARYWPLVQQTFCVNRPNTLLYLSWNGLP